MKITRMHATADERMSYSMMSGLDSSFYGLSGFVHVVARVLDVSTFMARDHRDRRDQ